MNSSPEICNKDNKNSVDDIISAEILENSKIKSIDNRKLIANEKFDKIGHLPIQSIGNNNKEIQEPVDKIPVLDILSNNYPNELSFTDYHRPCNCTKSYCLKLYCECFARDKLCLNCNCNNCMNNIGHEKSRSTALLRILDKNPLAFLPKIGSGQGHKLHRKGCNCKRSECLKNYCECREAKIECSMLCRCQGCKNRSSELSSYSSQPPCSLDMAILDSNGFKNTNLYKSSNMIDNDKPTENQTNDVNFPFTNVYDEASMNPSNMYCNDAAMSDYGANINYPPVNSTMEDLMKINENYKKLNDNFYKRSSQETHPHSEDFVNSKQSRMMNWSAFVNINPENNDSKPLSNSSAYNILNYSKYPNHRRIHIPYPSSFSSDLDENSNRMLPTNNFQYFNDNDDYLYMPPVNYYKSFNSMPHMKRFNDNQYQFSGHLNNSQGPNVHSSDKCEQNDIAEVTSTNEMDANTMLVSSNCDSLPQHSALTDNSIIKPPSCDSHSPMSMTTNENYNCYPFGTDSVYSSTARQKFAMKYSQNPPQTLNGHVLPSLFHNECENVDLNQRIPYFRHNNINQSQNISNNINSPSTLHRKSGHLPLEDSSTSRYSSNSNFINNNNSNFFNFYNEQSDSSYIYPNVPIENEDLFHKSDLKPTINMNNPQMYSEHFNPFFYGAKNDIYSKVTCSSNPQ